jgi:hypothetical protein
MYKTIGKTIRAIAAVILVLLALAACGSSSKRLSGTYTAVSANLLTGLPFSSITFSGKDTVSMSALGIVGTSGTYSIKDDKMTLKYTEPALFSTGKEVTDELTYSRDGKKIYLNGYEFDKDDSE